MNLEIQTESRDNIQLLHIKGEVDLYSSPELRKTILSVVNGKSPNILVNLQDVRYMDSSGVATLIEGLQVCNKNKGRFVLAGLNDNVREVFELTKLDKIFNIFPDVESAMEN